MTDEEIVSYLNGKPLNMKETIEEMKKAGEKFTADTGEIGGWNHPCTRCNCIICCNFTCGCTGYGCGRCGHGGL